MLLVGSTVNVRGHSLPCILMCNLFMLGMSVMSVLSEGYGGPKSFLSSFKGLR